MAEQNGKEKRRQREVIQALERALSLAKDGQWVWSISCAALAIEWATKALQDEK